MRRNELKNSSAYLKSSLSNLNPYDLHKKLINDYLLFRHGSTSLLHRDSSKDKRDIDVIRENHKFLWDDNDTPDSWEARLAKKYYDKLFKEYCICDLSRYKENKIAMRWRTEQEVVLGKGQFSCGNKHCKTEDDLHSWEVNFAYLENDEKKNALVKARLCSPCSEKLNYKHKKREIICTKKRKSNDNVENIASKKSKASDEVEVECAQKQTSDENNGIDTEEGRIWREANKPEEEKSRDQEFEAYLEELLL